MDSSKDPVWILFITDIESRDKLLKYSSGSQWEVDPVTAAALIMAGAAVRMLLDEPQGRQPTHPEERGEEDPLLGERLSALVLAQGSQRGSHRMSLDRSGDR